MRVVVVLAAIVVAVTFAPRAHAQVPSSVPVATVSTEDQPEGRQHPWRRLWIYAPVSILIGAGVVVARRAARDRGLLQS